jgi:hypothetical protein
VVVSGHRVYTDADLEHQYSGKLINFKGVNSLDPNKRKGY